MRKIFTFLFAALMSVGMYATTVVTITQNDFPQHGKSFTKDGVTVSAGSIDGMDGNLMQGGSFSTTLGNFTKIVVTAEGCEASGTGWSGNWLSKTWAGTPASTVSFSGDFMGMGNGITIVCTIEEPTVAVTGVTLNQSEAQMTVGGETLTLTATVNPNNATDQSVSWSTSDANVATVENGVVTAVAAGNATITVTTTDGSFTATCAVTVTAPAPADKEITPNVDPENPTVYYSTFFDSANKYELPAGVEAYIVTTVSGDAMQLQKVAEAGQTIPAGAGVILKASVTPFTLSISDADAVSVEGNRLEGSDDAITTPSNCYVLSCENNLVGFYHYTAGNLNAHKAYIIYSGSNQAPRRLRFVFDQATGVENVQGNVQSTKVIENGVLYIIKNGVKYNAQGQIVK